MRQHFLVLLLVCTTSAAFSQSVGERKGKGWPEFDPADTITTGFDIDTYSRRHVPAVWVTDFQMSRYFVDRFNASDGFGVRRMVAVPMTVSDLMRLEVLENSHANAKSDLASSIAAKNYGIYRLELIAIAKHDAPVVFNQPNHKHASNAEIVRSLTNFEAKAVEELRAGKDVTFEVSSDGHSRNVVGAIRATEDCLQCHEQYKVGDVLGALSFQLSETNPLDKLQLANTNHEDQLYTTTAHLLGVEGSLEQARDAVKQADPNMHGDSAAQAQAYIEKALAAVARAKLYVAAHPEIDPIKRNPKVAPLPEKLRLPTYAIYLPESLDSKKEYSFDVPDGESHKPKVITFGPEDGRQIRIDQDGKGLSVPMIHAIWHLREAQRHLSGPPNSTASGIGALDGERERILDEIGLAAAKAVVAIDYAHEHVTGAPVKSKQHSFQLISPVVDAPKSTSGN